MIPEATAEVLKVAVNMTNRKAHSPEGCGSAEGIIFIFGYLRSNKKADYYHPKFCSDLRRTEQKKSL